MKKYQVRVHTTHATHPFEDCRVYWAESYGKASGIVERIIASIRKAYDVWDMDEMPSDNGESYYIDYWDKMRTTLTIVAA